MAVVGASRQSLAPHPPSLRKPVTKRVENRPHSTKLFTSRGRYPETLPSYMEDYSPKPLVNTPCVRSGTSSGNRRNNPHPSEAFMVWRLSPSFLPLTDASSSASLHQNLLTPQEQLKSTYQDDYLGLQQGQLLHGSSGKTGVSTPLLPGPAYSLATSTRRAYQALRPTTSLRGNTTRYGCSVDFVKPACGIVPTLIPATIVDATYDTWYQTEFGPEEHKETSFGSCPRRTLPPRHLPPITSPAVPMTSLPVTSSPDHPARVQRSSEGGILKRVRVLTGAKRVLRKPVQERGKPVQLVQERADFVDVGTHKLPTWLSKWSGPM